MHTVPAPSPYQQAIVSELSRPGEHVVIHATAGAGKTTVLVQISRVQPGDSSQLCLAFARDAAAELKRRLPAGVDTRTVHSLGRRIVANALKSRSVELLPPQPQKYRRLAGRILRERLPTLASAASAHFLAELCATVRLQLVDPADTAALRELMLESGLWPPVELADVDSLFALLPELLQRGLAQADRGLLDFGDMLFVPVRRKLPVPSYDLVCVDEAQDYSPVALELTLGLASAGARLVFVGDPRQSIFGFAGADPQAMQSISQRLSARVLPLSVTYRCPRLHVELARELAPEMEAAPGAPAGTVSVIGDKELARVAAPGDLVLCRLNAPLIEACIRLTAAGLPAFVRGADLQDRLQRLANRVFGRGLERPLEQLRLHLRSELRRLASGDVPLAGVAGQRLQDEIACLQHLCGAAEPRDMSELEKRIGSMFGGGPGSLVLSSIHRAKGQEADRVLLLYPELLPAPYARSLRALRGEASVQFVALTRARRELVLVESGQGDGRPPPPAAGPDSGAATDADDERELILAAWQRVLFKARAGRRHRQSRGNDPAGQAGTGSRHRHPPVWPVPLQDVPTGE